MNFASTASSRRYARPYCHCSLIALFLGLLLFSAVNLARGVSPGFADQHPPGPSSDFAIADFDGDHQPDIATVRAGHTESRQSSYSISVQFSKGSNQSFGVIAPVGGIQLDSRDVNGDHHTDLVISTSWFGQTVAILLNDGRGNFVLVDPERFPGVRLETHKEWSGPLPCSPDVVAAMPLSRYTPRAFPADFGSVFYVTQGDLFFVATGGVPSLHLTVLSAGRAPPHFFHLS